jgi:tellurite resistance protein TerC
VILILVGVKMLLEDYVDIPILITLGVVAAVLLISIALSVVYPAKAVASQPTQK